MTIGHEKTEIYKANVYFVTIDRMVSSNIKRLNAPQSYKRLDKILNI